MYTKSSLKERCQRILEENGGHIADQASRILLEDPKLKDLRSPLEFISKNWRDPLTPALMGLSCEAVGGRSEATHEAALAMSLMNLSFNVWDDIVDKARFKVFKPTLFGKFGEGTALMIGGVASAKAFSIFSQMDLNKTKRQTISKMFWNLWTKMASAEAINLRLRSQGKISSRKKLLVIKSEAAADVGTCLRIGAVLGNGSEVEIRHLGSYGLYLGTILELWKGYLVSINLTLGLAEKIRNGTLPYPLLWAKERSEKIQKKLEDLTKMNIIKPSDIKEIVENTFETKVLNNTMKNVKKLANRAEKELYELKMNRATQTLKFFVNAQPDLLIESLSMFQAEHS